METRLCCGCSRADVQFVSPEVLCHQCGSSLVLLHVQSGQQRILGSSKWHTIQSWACSKGGFLAVATLQRCTSIIEVYSTHDLQLQASVTAGANLGYSAVALSHDGELLAACANDHGSELSLWHWRKGFKLAAAKLHAPVSQISFHPADNSCLLTTASEAPDHASTAAAGAGEAACSKAAPSAVDAAASQSGSLLLWQLHRLWDRHELQSTALQTASGCKPTCHAWAPEGVYVGCTDGSVLCLSPQTGATQAHASIAAAMLPATAVVEPSSADDGTGVTAAASRQPGPVSSLALNKHWLAVACQNCPHIVFFQRCGSSSSSTQHAASLQALGSVQVSSVGCGGVSFGGPARTSLAVCTIDGSLLLLLPGSHFEAAQPDPGSLQVEPLADWHTGAITGLAAAYTGSHLISCGVDGSIRVWAAAAGGQLVSKRDVGGRLTCCAAHTNASSSLLAIGSWGGVLRLIDASDLSTLPVVHHSRLFRAPVTHVAFSSCAAYLAVAAGSTQRLALLKVAATGQQVQLLGYVKAAGTIMSMCWLPSGTGSRQPHLMVALSNGSAMLLTPPLQPAELSACAAASSSGSTAGGDAALDLSHAAAHVVNLSGPAAMQALAVLPQPLSGNAGQSRSGSAAGGSLSSNVLQVLGAGSDGQLYWLQLDAASMHSQHRAGSQQLSALHSVALPWPAAALAVSPTGQQVLAAAADGAVVVLPTATAAAGSVLAAAGAGRAQGWNVGASATAGTARGGAELVWSFDARWAGSAGPDGSLMMYSTGADGTSESDLSAAAIPPSAASVQDLDTPDDSNAPTLPQAMLAKADQEAFTAAEPVRKATLQRLQDLKGRLAQALEANAVAPADQQLSAAELVLNVQLLTELRGGIAVEEAQLLSEAPRQSQEQEVQAKRLKALCWDAFKVKRAVCTGLKSADTQVWNFQLPVQEDSAWAQVAEQRRDEILAANKQVLDQDFFGRSAASSSAAGIAPNLDSDSAAGAAGSMDGRSSDGGAAPSTVASSIARGGSDSCDARLQETLALLARLRGCTDAKDCKAADLLLPELAVTTPQAKLMQSEVYKRMVWELKTQFNQDFDALVKQKHTDADRLADLNTRVDELIRELVKIHLVLNPAAVPDTDDAASTPPAAMDAAAGPSTTASRGSSGTTTARDGPSGPGGSSGAQHNVLSGAQLSADLAAGRLVPFWSPDENMEDLLLNIQPGEIKAAKYLTPAERAKADADEAAAEAARRAAAADSSRGRALQQMMGGRLERSVDEVSELVTSRPAWMVSGDPSSFNEEQLKEYKEYMAKEAAAIEERLKRKGIMETELRTLKAAAEDVARKFDAAVAALAAKRLDVLAEVTALEARVLQLLADEEVATVTAGPEAQQQAADKLQAAQAALAAVDQELLEVQQLYDQQQEALAGLHAEEKAADRAFKRDFAHVDPLVLPTLTSLYKARLVPKSDQGSSSAGLVGHAAAPAGRAGSASRAAVGVSPRQRGAQGSGVAVGSPRTAKPGQQGAGRTDGALSAMQAHTDSQELASAELAFSPLQLPVGPAAAGAADAAAAVASGSGNGGAARASSALSAAQRELCGPLGPPEVLLVELSDSQMPEGLDDLLWQRFVELHVTRARLDYAVREQTAGVLCLKHQLQLLLQRQAQLSGEVQAAAAALDSIWKQQQQALNDVEVQLKLKQGQVELWPGGLSSIAPEALLVARQEVKGLNSVILSKGEAKLDMLRKMKEFKRGIHQLEWENKKCEMEAQDVTSLTQHLQLLHVTKEFQQQVKAGGPGGSSGSSLPGGMAGGGSSAAPLSGRTAGVPAAAAVGGAAAGAGNAAANKEVASLENLLKVCETLHTSSVEQKRRQLRSLEAQLAAKRNENATLALHLAGLERLLDEAARLRAAATADEATSAAERKARSLAMQSKLRDIADAQAAEIAAAQRELLSWQQRCFPCLPSLAGDDDQQPSGGADQAGPVRGPAPYVGAGSCTLPEIKGASGQRGLPDADTRGAGGGGVTVAVGGFAPHGARAAAAKGAGALEGSPTAGMFAVKRGKKTFVGPDGKPGLFGSRR